MMTALSNNRLARTSERLALAILYLVVFTALAHAHAVLLETEPGAGTRLPDVPDTVRLSFNERVEPVFNSIRVVDRLGRRVDEGNVRLADEGDTVEIAVRPLTDGPYTVFWKINSADGHQVQGSFGFGVRVDAPDQKNLPTPAGRQRSLIEQPFVPTVKWAGLMATVLWIGGLCFVALVLQPAFFGSAPATEGSVLGEDAAKRCGRLLCSAGTIWIMVQCLALLGQTAAFADVSLHDAASPSLWETVLTSTNYGHWWIVSTLSGLALLAICFVSLRRRGSEIPGQPGSQAPARMFGFGNIVSVGAIVLGSVMLLAIPMTGHAHVVGQRTALAVVSDWIHLVGSVIWVGGLIHLFVIAVPLARQGDRALPYLNNLAHRFSGVVRICVLLILVTGAYAAWIHLPSWSAFLSPGYGQVLLAKLLVLMPMLLIAAVNWRRVLPALAAFMQKPEKARRWALRFRGLIRAEAVLGAVILGLVAVLTGLPPASALTATGPVSVSKQTGDTTVTLNLSPNRIGSNELVVTVTNKDGAMAADARRVTVYLRMLDMDMGLQTFEALPTPDGRYGVEVPIAMAGRWSITVEVSPAHGDTFDTEFQVNAAA